MDPIRRIQDNFRDSVELKLQACDILCPVIARAAEKITGCLLEERKIVCCANGSSAADAQRFTTKMLNGYELERPGLPAVALNADTSTLTAIADDYQFADIFSRQIRAIGQPGDVLLAINASGESHNMIHAIDAAHERGMYVIALTGREGGQLADLIREVDIEIRVPSWSTSRIQETHVLIIHCLCDLIDHHLLGGE